MCLKPQTLPPIPEDTRRLAQQLFPPHHILRLIGDEYADVSTTRILRIYIHTPGNLLFPQHTWR